MDREMGYRNMLAVEELASQGKLTVTHKGARSFDFAQYALLSRMAWLTADWPLDKAAKALEALHVEEIEALGKPFDPNFMNAVQQIPAPDGQESGTVVTVYQKGYKLGDKIVRHATVVVAE